MSMTPGVNEQVHGDVQMNGMAGRRRGLATMAPSIRIREPAIAGPVRSR